jgi:hypothetical protein
MTAVIIFQDSEAAPSAGKGTWVEQSTFESEKSALEYLRVSGLMHDGVIAILDYDGCGQTSTYDGNQLDRMIDSHVREFETSMREQSHLESEIPN